jgi:hypothetical protein
MGWEYRIFFRPRADVGRTLPEAGDRFEVRSDIYFSHSVGVGVKARGESMLELKVRLEVDDLGFEKWRKYKPGDERELAKLLRQLGQPAMPTARCEVTLTKRRAQAGHQHVTFEETDLVVRVGTTDDDERNPHSDINNDVCAARADGAGGAPAAEEVWRSLAVEGKRGACEALRQQLIPRAVAAAEGGVVIVCGYPLFVERAAKRAIAARVAESRAAESRAVGAGAQSTEAAVVDPTGAEMITVMRTKQVPSGSSEETEEQTDCNWERCVPCGTSKDQYAR